MQEFNVVIKISKDEVITERVTEGTLFASLAEKYQNRYKDKIVLASINNNLRELNKEIEKLIEDNKDKPMNGITIEADLFFLGRCMKHGIRCKRKMMMFKRSCGRIEDRRRDAHSVISEGYSASTKNKFLHYDFKSLDNYIKRYNWYATREMQDYIDYKKGEAGTEIETDKAIQQQRKKKFGLYYKAPKFFRAWLWFLYNYIFRGGFLDGKEGLAFCFLECYWYRFLVDAKIFEYEKNGGEFEKLKAID